MKENFHTQPGEGIDEGLGEARTFDSGATRDTDEGKLDYEGFFSPLVLRRRAEFMHKHRFQSDQKLRASDNWQKGMPFDAYMKSGHRHFMDWWLEHRGASTPEGIEEAICALMFNAEGYLHELLQRKERIQTPKTPRPIVSAPPGALKEERRRATWGQRYSG